jgi:hypothetical protein
MAGVLENESAVWCVSMADCQIVQAACSNDRQEAFEQEGTEKL